MYKKSNWTQLLVKRQPDELKQKMHKAEHLFKIIHMILSYLYYKHNISKSVFNMMILVNIAMSQHP